MTKPPVDADSLKDRMRRAAADVPRRGGLIPPAEWTLARRLEALEARVAELEKRYGK